MHDVLFGLFVLPAALHLLLEGTLLVLSLLVVVLLAAIFLREIIRRTFP